MRPSRAVLRGWKCPLVVLNAVVQTALSLTAMDVETLVLLQHLGQDEVLGLPLNRGTLLYISRARYLMLEFFSSTCRAGHMMSLEGE